MRCLNLMSSKKRHRSVGVLWLDFAGLVVLESCTAFDGFDALGLAGVNGCNVSIYMTSCCEHLDG